MYFTYIIKISMAVKANIGNVYTFRLSLCINSASRSCPVLWSAGCRASSVGEGWLGEAHLNHWLSISLKYPVTPSGISSGVRSIVVSSLSRNPRESPNFFHCGVTGFNKSKMMDRSLSFKVTLLPE